MDRAGGKAAVVLAGGGARGAYEVGVMRALFEGACASTGHRPLRPAVYTGTSVGAFNAAFVATRAAAVDEERAVGELRRVWLRRIARRPGVCGSGVFRLHGVELFNPSCFFAPPTYVFDALRDAFNAAQVTARTAGRFAALSGPQGPPLTGAFLESFDASAFVDPRPLRELIRDVIDFAALRRGRPRLAVTASDWDNGGARVFTDRELAGGVGPEAIHASMAIPGIFPKVGIDGVCYVDGGVLMNAPLEPAIEAGATSLHLIYLDPRLENSDLGDEVSTLDALVRTYAIITAEQIKEDFERHRAINRGLELLGRVAGGGRVAPTEEDAYALGMADRVRRRGRRARKIELHHYRPPGDLGGASSLLDFRESQIERFIRQGYRDAVEHDCEDLGCETI